MSDGTRVRIQLGDEDSYVIERYEIKQSFFTQPGAFAARVGHGGLTRDLLAKYPPGIPFVLWIDLPDGRSVPQMCGRIDDVTPEGSAGATEVNLRGRDWMAPIHDGMSKVEKSFGRATFKELTEAVIRLAGVEGYSIKYDNSENRRAVQGIPRFETRQVFQRPDLTNISPVTKRLYAQRLAIHGPVAYGVFLATLGTTVDVNVIAGYDVPNPPKVKPGQTLLSFLQEHHNRGGLFMFAGVDEKTYILTQPSTSQSPVHRIVRRRGDSYGVIAARHKNATARRYSNYTVYGRGGGGGDPRKQIVGEYVDDEMVGWGLIKQWSKVDDLAKTSKSAEFLAKRYAAEARRTGWDLAYTLRGHTWPIIGSSTQVAIPALDTIWEIVDEEYGIYGPHWVAEIAMRGEPKSPGATTEIVFQRPADQVHGDEVIEPKTAKKKGWQRR